MATKKCIDCMSYEPCSYWGNILDPIHGGVTCSMFKDKSKFVERPCNVGDVVWAYLRAWKKEDGIVPYQITNLTITQSKRGAWTKKYRAMWLVDGKTRDRSIDFAFDEIGERVFLTEEEAKEKLEA